MLQDLRFGLKLLVKERAFTVTALLTLALCIGANTAIFTVLNAVVLNPLPFSEPDRLVRMWNIYPAVGFVGRGSNSAPDMADRKSLTDVFESIAMTGGAGFDVGGEGTAPLRVDAQAITPSFFQVLRISTMLGRPFTDEEATFDKSQFAILSYGLWKDLYAKDPNAVGKDIRLSGQPYRIVGVMPEGFESPGVTVRLWVPQTFSPQQLSDGNRHSNNWGMIARLKPGVPVAYAQQRIDALNKQLEDKVPALRQLIIDAKFRTVVSGMKDEMVQDIKPTLFLLQGAVTFVLLIGCVNVANLQLARASTRRREFAVRRAIGAGANRLMRQLLTESLCVSAIGGAAGIALLLAAKASLVRLIPEGLPRLNDITLNWSVLLFAIAVTLACGIVFGCAPAVAVRRPDVMPVLQTSIRGGSGSRGQARTRNLLVVVEVALSIVLMIAAGLLLRSFRDLLSTPLGFDPTAVITVRTRLPYPNDTSIDRYPSADKEAPFLRELLRRARAIPGVERAAVGSSSAIPLDHAHRDVNTMPLLVEGRGADAAQAPVVDGSVVTPGYFQLLGMTAVRGRLFTEFDSETTPAVAVINEAMARAFWPHGDAIGTRVKLSRSATTPWTTIVGIVADARTETLADAAVPQVYASAFQKVAKHLAIFLRGPVDTAATADRVRDIVQSLDPTLPVFGAQPLTEAASRSLAARRFAMQIVTLFALTAWLLAALGIYGVMSYTIAARTNDIGIRLALGASRERTLADIVGRGLTLAIVGTIVGLLCAAVVARLMAGVLHGIQPLDPITFAAVPIALLTVALCACGIPARRALRIDPLLALRCE